MTTLSHAAFRVLATFAAGYTGTNNETLCCIDTWMKQFGIVSRDTTAAAIRELLDRRLIEGQHIVTNRARDLDTALDSSC